MISSSSSSCDIIVLMQVLMHDLVIIAEIGGLALLVYLVGCLDDLLVRYSAGGSVCVDISLVI